MVALSGLEWSIGRPSGIGGVGAHVHVGSGQVGIVGKGGRDGDDLERDEIVCACIRERPPTKRLFIELARRGKVCKDCDMAEEAAPIETRAL